MEVLCGHLLRLLAPAEALGWVDVGWGGARGSGEMMQRRPRLESAGTDVVMGGQGDTAHKV
jgi:hypothetical protein